MEHAPVDWRRLRCAAAAIVCVALFLSATGRAIGFVIAGLLAENATAATVALLASVVLSAVVMKVFAHVIWAGVVDRAEGRLRADLLDAALAQPLSKLSEQAVGEVLDRVDDDTHEVGTLLRGPAFWALHIVLGVGPLWVVAGFVWWPSAILLPVTAVAAWLSIRRILPLIAERKVAEEAAWSAHAAAVEEAVAARDDIRTSLGQAHVIRTVAALSADIHRKFSSVLKLEALATLRSGVLLSTVLAAITVAGIYLVTQERASVAQLVTLFTATSMFVAQVDRLMQQLPDLQRGLGAVFRLRAMLAVEPEPSGGDAVPAGDLDVHFRDLDFSYGTGTFALRNVNITIPAGQTCALVGRTGSGKSTVVSLLVRSVEPNPGTVFLGGADVRDLNLHDLRSTIGVVNQRTEILAGSLAENITLFADVPREQVAAVIDQLGLTDWVAELDDGLDTLLGPGGLTLSAGEEQLVAFARLLVRDVRVVVLDEATARMDPLTESRVVRAADRLLAGRTGILVAHRLSTTARAHQIAVLDHGRVVEHGRRDELACAGGTFHALLRASGDLPAARMPDRPEAGVVGCPGSKAQTSHGGDTRVGTRRRMTRPPPQPRIKPLPGLTRAVWDALNVARRWCWPAIAFFAIVTVLGGDGVVTAWLWGHLVQRLDQQQGPWSLASAMAAGILIGPLCLSIAVFCYPRWWIEVLLRTRLSVLVGQTNQRRLPATPPGEVVARALDSDRYAQYADRWVDFGIGLTASVLAAVLAGSWLAGAVLVAVMLSSTLACALGRSVAGRSAAAASAARAQFGRAVVSALDSVRTVKLAAATPDVYRHLQVVDQGRVGAAIREHRVQALLKSVSLLMVQLGFVAAWAGLLMGWWPLATALLLATTVHSFEYLGQVSGEIVTQAPGTRAWLHATSRLAGGGSLVRLPAGVNLLTGEAPDPQPTAPARLQTLRLHEVSAVHDDGTVGVEGVNCEIRAGELVLLVGQVGSGKSSLLRALAGLVATHGRIEWNGQPLDATELRPGRVALVGQVPRVLSGTFETNIQLDHTARRLAPAVATARLERDIGDAGGPGSAVGHRGTRLSGGQVQRLALARAVACEAGLLLADDVSSALDVTTELELWTALRAAGTTVLGATSKAAALAQADRVFVLDSGRIVDSGPWAGIAHRWAHLAG